MYLMLPIARSLTVQLQAHPTKLLDPDLQAARAYDAAAVAIRGPSAKTNFKYPFQLLHLKHRRGKVGAVAGTLPAPASVPVHGSRTHGSSSWQGPRLSLGSKVSMIQWALMRPISALFRPGLGPAIGVLPSSVPAPAHAWHLPAWTAH